MHASSLAYGSPGSTGCMHMKPLSPGLMAASVWMTSWMGRPVLPELISLPVPEMTPDVSV